MRVRLKHKTIGLRSLIIVCCFVVTGFIIYQVFANQHEDVKAYPAGCVTQACREAADNAEAAERAAANAQTLEGEVARLDAEIASLEADILRNQAIADDLSAQITENEAKLNLQQSALAKLLVDLHFEEEPDAIILLAGSSSLGDLAEKQSRQATAKAQITTTN